MYSIRLFLVFWVFFKFDFQRERQGKEEREKKTSM